MKIKPQRPAREIATAFADLVGVRAWSARQAVIRKEIGAGQRAGRAAMQRYAIEFTLERLRTGPCDHPSTRAESCLLAIAAEALRCAADASRDGRANLKAMLRDGLAGERTLLASFHLFRTAALQRSRGFEVRYARLEDGATFDLLIERDGVAAEIACDVVSADEGRDVHRGAWITLVDAIDPDLQIWLANHPGRYLLKLTLPQGLRGGADGQPGLAALHGRIRDMLRSSRRADHDEAAVLRLDPLMLAAAQADENGLMNSLRREFGHEAHLAVTGRGQGVFALAARAGRENEIAVAIRRRMAALAPACLTGTRPGILAMFVEDTDAAEWRHLRDRLELEGEARQFLTHPEARCVVAITCSSRLELFGAAAPHAAPDGELRFRNPAHPAAKTAALAPAVLSSI